MTHIFKPGDRAYWLRTNQWVELVEASDYKPKEFTIQTKDRGISFTAEGKNFLGDETVSLLPINPYDPIDPNNSPEFRYTFMLNGRPVKIGDVLVSTLKKRNTLRKVNRLILESDFVAMDMDAVNLRHRINPEYFCRPDEVVTKKKVAKWAYPILRMPGGVQIGFTDEMTKEEAEKKYGSFVHMIPGTEREVEG